MRKEARHTQRRDQASGVPLDILEHQFPSPMARGLCFSYSIRHCQKGTFFPLWAERLNVICSAQGCYGTIFGLRDFFFALIQLKVAIKVSNCLPCFSSSVYQLLSRWLKTTSSNCFSFWGVIKPPPLMCY